MERWDRVGRYGGYGAALALSPYLLIKVSWVIGALLGLAPVGAGFTLAGWVFLNTVTVAMAAVGIALALALVQPWGLRIPGRPVAFCAWTGAGFLVSILPYAVLSTVLDAGRDEPKPAGGGGDGPAMPGWEVPLVQFGFIGMGLGLALAVPGYLRRRWPAAVSGRLPARPGRATPWAAAAAAVVGTCWLYWAAGGTLGIADPAERETNWHLLAGVGALWALAAAAAAGRAPGGRHPDRARGPLRTALVWLGSGSLFAWSAWKLPFTLYAALAHPTGGTLPEHVAVAAPLHLIAALSGALLLRSLVGSRDPHLSGRYLSGPARPRRSRRPPSKPR
ncbi:hypothetical protein DSC45_19615 [Streptomyces sp. YIM 130001]|uniref:hypothetical protein n=1 Tax=Streptomyces sp. YIM 130001 TaxID=2259644 RepID=UPI000EE8C9A4|nr:hypothetical protein [Streptomyces sp. YIM 130001]RII15106.1 hypothetical protein DSC45_19615 [Streptomyces sp. YIM 130001]